MPWDFHNVTDGWIWRGKKNLFFSRLWSTILIRFWCDICECERFAAHFHRRRSNGVCVCVCVAFPATRKTLGMSDIQTKTYTYGLEAGSPFGWTNFALVQRDYKVKVILSFSGNQISQLKTLLNSIPFHSFILTWAIERWNQRMCIT